MQVPFLLRAPYRQIGRGLRVPAQVRGIDLMPTVLDLVGVPVPGDVQGASLVPLADGTETDLGLWAYSESFYPRNHYGWSPLRALRNGLLHFISAPRPELFEVLEDPGETRNLAPERPGQVRQLQARLDQLVAEYEKEEPTKRPPRRWTRRRGPSSPRSATWAALRVSGWKKVRNSPTPRTRSSSTTC